MIEQQIRPWEVLDGQVLALLSEVKRENFAPMAHKALAFVDMEIPLSKDGSPDQVMLAPRVEARFLQNAAVKPTDKVMEIGTGSALYFSEWKTNFLYGWGLEYLDQSKYRGNKK